MFQGSRTRRSPLMDEQYTELERKFPRIIERIVELWNKFELDDYLNEIMIDDRGNRQGFPEEVASEILFLRALHGYHMRGANEAKPNAHTVWINPEYSKPTSHEDKD
jgi:hypothetical protein